MGKSLRKKDIKGLEKRINNLQDEQRRSTIEIINRINTTGSNIISAIFSESKKVRDEIGHHTIMLKLLEDNLQAIRFDDSIGISSKIEVTVGGEVFGTGAKWVWDIDLGKVSHQDVLRALELTPGIASSIKDRAASKLRKLLVTR